MSPELNASQFQPEADQIVEEQKSNKTRSLKQKLGRIGAAGLMLVTGIVASIGVKDAVEPREAHASTVFANDYPNLNAKVYNLATYDWWVDENGNNNPDVNPDDTFNDEEMSARGYGYRNCTDGADYWVGKYTAVNVAGWGNALSWATKAATAGYSVYDGNSNSIEPGDIAQDESGTYGHVGFVTDVAKNISGVVTSITVAELNKDANGNYSHDVYSAKNSANKFTRNTAGADWDHFIDVNGPNKGLNNEALDSPPPPSTHAYEATATNTDGTVEIFAIGADNNIYSNREAGPNSNAWNGWRQLQGGNATTITAAKGASGQMGVFFTATDGKVHYYWETAPNTNTWGPMQAINAGVIAVNAVTNQDGTIELDAIGSADGTIYENREAGRNLSSWNGWTQLQGGNATSIDATPGASGQLGTYFIATDGKVHYYWQASANVDNWGAMQAINAGLHT